MSNRRVLSGEGEESRQGEEQPPLEHLLLHLREGGVEGGGGEMTSAAAGAREALISSSVLPTFLVSLAFDTCNSDLKWYMPINPMQHPVYNLLYTINET